MQGDLASFQEASVTGLLCVGHRYVILSLKTAGSFHYRAGQYTQLELSDADGLFYRYYSIASAPHPSHIFQLCLLISDSRVWHWLRSLSLGQSVRIATAAGNFPIPSTERPMILLAGGSGITPLKAITEDVVRDPQAQVSLIYSCQQDDEIPFYDDLMALAHRHPKFHVSFFAEDVRQHRARPGRGLDHLGEFLDPEASYLLCGPPAFMEAARQLLSAAAIPEARIHQDRF